jgi:hypothetical protein
MRVEQLGEILTGMLDDKFPAAAISASNLFFLIEDGDRLLIEHHDGTRHVANKWHGTDLADDLIDEDWRKFDWAPFSRYTRCQFPAEIPAYVSYEKASRLLAAHAMALAEAVSSRANAISELAARGYKALVDDAARRGPVLQEDAGPYAYGTILLDRDIHSYRSKPLPDEAWKWTEQQVAEAFRKEGVRVVGHAAHFASQHRHGAALLVEKPDGSRYEVWWHNLGKGGHCTIEEIRAIMTEAKRGRLDRLHREQAATEGEIASLLGTGTA